MYTNQCLSSSTTYYRGPIVFPKAKCMASYHRARLHKFWIAPDREASKTRLDNGFGRRENKEVYELRQWMCVTYLKK
ncbi:hypothetical protein VNO77_34696 [Canavalia gladiata]|uniref:Uncharacterized protein n=1 Tax=Canavalia gladiata TaxID=3824 RepID=A0AAN9KHW1_CANGL